MFELKLRNPGWKAQTIFRRGSKLEKYCKTCKISIADPKIIKKLKYCR